MAGLLTQNGCARREFKSYFKDYSKSFEEFPNSEWQKPVSLIFSYHTLEFGCAIQGGAKTKQRWKINNK